MDIFSVRVKWLREKRGLSQKEVAEFVGMSPAGYGKIENGQREPSLEKLARFPEVLGESVDFMIGVHDLTKEIESVMEDISMMEKSIKFSSETLSKLTEEKDQEYRTSTIDVFNLSSSMLIRFNERLAELKSEIPNK